MGRWTLAGLAAFALASGCSDPAGGAGPDTGTTDDGADDPDDGETGAGPADSTGGDDPDAGSETGDDPELGAPPPGGMRRLLDHQYVASIAVLLGPSAAVAAAPPANGTLGAFEQVAATESNLPPSAIDGYEASALAIAQAVVADRSYLAQTIPCVQDGPFDQSCYSTLAEDLGRLAWRRPLTEAEVEQLAALGVLGLEWEDGVGFDDGLRAVLLALLQSPDFLYIVEVGEPDDDGDSRRLTQRELAVRLSFFLAGATPDAALLDLADADGLGDSDAIREVAWSLLERPEAREQVGRFYTELLRIGDLRDKGKDTDLFPLWDDATAASMHAETLRMVDHVVFGGGGDIRTLFDADFTFADDNIAALYGIEAPEAPWSQVALPDDSDRAGILTMPAFLSATSFTTRNSPTRRGLFVQDRLLCFEIPPPPPDVDANLPDPAVGVTLRERLEQHMTDDACAACHALTDPIGFAFEGFDAIGVARALDNGQPIDTTGEISGVGSFAGAAELGALLRNDPRVPGCMLDNLFVYALGYSDTGAYADGLLPLHDAFVDYEHDLQSIVVELTVSPLFARVGPPK